MKEDASPDDGRKKKEGEKSGGRSQTTPPGTASALHTQSKPDKNQRSGIFPCIFCSKEDHRSAACPMNLDHGWLCWRRKGGAIAARKEAIDNPTAPKTRNVGSATSATKCSSALRALTGTGSTKEPNGGAPKDSGAASKTIAAAAHQASQKDIILKTATVVLYGPKGFMRVRCLLDSGSHRSYVITKVAEALALQKKGVERLEISDSEEERTLKRLKFGLGGLNENKPACNLKCLETERICDPIAGVAIDQWLQRINALDLPLADDPEELRGERWNGEIDLLIGTEH